MSKKHVTGITEENLAKKHKTIQKTYEKTHKICWLNFLLTKKEFYYKRTPLKQWQMLDGSKIK